MNAIVSIGTSTFRASLASPVESSSWIALAKLLPYAGPVLHARWSGEAVWSPLRAAWPVESRLPEEDAIAQPRPGQILLYAGQDSEPELLVAYGQTRFACAAGPLRGNPVLTIVDRLDELAQAGRAILENGAGMLRIEFEPFC